MYDREKERDAKEGLVARSGRRRRGLLAARRDRDGSRRGFLGIVGAAGVAAGLSACAGTGGSATGASGGSSGTIEFWSNHPGNSKAVEQQIIKAFEALQGAEEALARRVHPTVMTVADWRAKRSRRDSFAARVAGQPKLFVIGSDDDLR